VIDQLLGVRDASLQYERVPIRTRFGRQRVIHVHDKERTGQSRGKPIFTSIMPLFKMLDHYELSEMYVANQLRRPIKNRQASISAARAEE
jgi:capsid protein